MNNYPFKRHFLLINNGKYPAICYIHMVGGLTHHLFLTNTHIFLFLCGELIEVGHEFMGKPQQ
jgi:hypothetical protein